MTALTLATFALSALTVAHVFARTLALRCRGSWLF